MLSRIGRAAAGGLETLSRHLLTFRVSGLFGRTELLKPWASTIVAEHVRTRGFEEGTDVPLKEYLDALVPQPVDKADAFVRLCAYFQSPDSAET